jgi:hypothetical protein
MAQLLDDSATFRIHVTAAAPDAPLAILSVASILGIEPQQAADRLAQLPTVLAENVAPPVARRLSALLTALGMQVRLDPTRSPRSSTMFDKADLAVQAAGPVPAEAIARLSRRLSLADTVVAEALLGPEGLVLRDRRLDEATALRRALRRQPALRVVASAQATAVHDAFHRPGSELPTAELMRLGLGCCRLTGAVATGMNRATALHLARRSQGNLLILDRAFQRFDLYAVAATGMDPRDLDRFLDARPAARRPTRRDGVRLVDANLPYHAALQFLADYTAIGVDVCLVLRGLPAAESR